MYIKVRVRVRVKKLLYRIIHIILYWARARPGPARRATKGWPGPPGTRPLTSNAAIFASHSKH